MSTYNENLPPAVITKWRNFASDGAFQFGLDWLRHNAAPAVAGATQLEKLESATAWNAYMKAIDDIEDRLTGVPRNDLSLDEPPLRT